MADGLSPLPPLMPPESDAKPGEIQRTREIRFALLAHPAVQIIRFLSKYILVWYIDISKFGEVTYAALIAFAVAQIAMFGLDEAVVFARTLSPGLLASLRRFHLISGVVVAGLFALSSPLLAGFLDVGHPGIGVAMLALAPNIWLQNQTVIPMALLVRSRRYRDLFVVDVAGIFALAGVTIALAAAGFDGASLIAGWYANTLVCWLFASRLSQDLKGDTGSSGDALAPTLKFGARLGGAGLYNYFSERLDSLAIGGRLGNALLGAYEMALHVSQPVINYAQSLADRYLFPVFANRQLRGGLTVTFGRYLRHTIAVWVPPHLVVAFLAAPLTEALMSPEWSAVGPILMVLPMVAAVRCIALVPLTVLKAAGLARAVLYVSIVETAFLAIGVIIGLRYGAMGVGWGVLIARTLALFAALYVTQLKIPMPWETWRTQIIPSVLHLVVWGTASWVLLGVIRTEISLPIGSQLALGIIASFATWLVTRLIFDREGLRWEWGLLRGHLAP